MLFLLKSMKTAGFTSRFAVGDRLFLAKGMKFADFTYRFRGCGCLVLKIVGMKFAPFTRNFAGGKRLLCIKRWNENYAFSVFFSGDATSIFKRVGGGVFRRKLIFGGGLFWKLI
jgi:hypothetical protein